MTTRSCTVVIGAAPLAERAHELVAHLVDHGWRVAVVPTPNAQSWIDEEAITRATANVGTPDPRRTDAAIVIPATFNTINKVALGIADTHAHSLLAELISTPTPVFWVPLINTNLWTHPRLADHLDLLRSRGAHFIDPHNGENSITPLTSGTGTKVAHQFDPEWITTRLDHVVGHSPS